MYTHGKKYFDQRKLIPRSKAIREYVKTTCYCQHFFFTSSLPRKAHVAFDLEGLNDADVRENCQQDERSSVAMRKNNIAKIEGSSYNVEFSIQLSLAASFLMYTW